MCFVNVFCHLGYGNNTHAVSVWLGSAYKAVATKKLSMKEPSINDHEVFKMSSQVARNHGKRADEHRVLC